MASLNTAISPAPTVTSLNKGGSVATGYTGNVTISLLTNPTGAALGGTLTVAASSGSAAFSNLTLNRSGKGFRLRAVGAAQLGVTPRAVTSAAFDIATELVFTTQPANGNRNTPIAPVVVTSRDSLGATDTGYTGVVTMSKYSGGGVLSGTLQVTAVAGVATFSTLEFDEDGEYLLKAEGTEVATAFKPAAAVSNAFSIGTNLTAGLDPGIFCGFIDGLIGAVSPSALNGYSIFFLGTDLGTSFTSIAVYGNATQDMFTSMTLNGNTYTSATAVYNYNSMTNHTQWSWAGEAITIGGTYSVGFT